MEFKEVDTVTRAVLVDSVHNTHPKIGKELIDTVISEAINQIEGWLKTDHRVELRGLGTFKRVIRKGRTARNPRNGEAVQVPDKYSIVFKPSSVFRHEVTQ